MTTRIAASKQQPLPVNDAPYTTVLYEDPATGQHLRSRLVPRIAQFPFESCRPIRNFPAYRGRRSHQGKYWFSRSESHVGFESRFEMTALMVIDFEGEATAVSSNPFWLLWPKDATSKRHAPDFFVRRRDGSALVVDVKPVDRITDRDRLQHQLTRDICCEMGWDYEEFTRIDPIVERNLRLLCGYHHRRFALTDDIRSVVTARLHESNYGDMTLAHLISAAREVTGSSAPDPLSGIYHMIWARDVHIDLAQPLAWHTVVSA